MCIVQLLLLSIHILFLFSERCRHLKNDINSRGGQGRGGAQGKGGEQGYVFDEIEILYQDNNFYSFSAMQ